MSATKHYLTVLLCALLIAGSVQGQFMEDAYTTVLQPEMPVSSQGGLILDAGGFFHNLEFFDVSEEGYTLPGSYLQPLVYYRPNPQLRVGAGAHLLYYHGEESFHQTYPVFQLQYQPTPELSLLLGSYKGGLTRHMPEPLNAVENHFTGLLNNGVEIRYRGSVHRSLSYLDWQEFIEPVDSLQEAFVFGHSSQVRILTGENYRLSLPLYILARHQGGQINESYEPVITRFNAGTGVQFDLDLNTSVWKELSLKADYYLQSGGVLHDRGHAFYPRAELNGPLFHLSAGYFYGFEWESIQGFRLFHFDQFKDDEHINGHPRFITFKAALNHRIGDSACLVVRFDGYFDQVVGKLQYVYGLHLLYSDIISLFSGRSE